LQRRPGIKLAVVEKKSFPIEDGTGTVGESLVEVSAHYLSVKLGLLEHLEKEQLPKLGLRYFLESEDNSDLENRLEVGGNRYPTTPSFQIDRARLENHLVDLIQSHGGLVFQQSRIRKLSYGEKGESHSIDFYSKDSLGGTQPFTLSGKWLIDASGRSGLTRNKFNLKQDSNHSGSAVWWRMDGEFRIDDWFYSEDRKQANQGRTARWFSTNHLMGRGYWVWIIPMASGKTSFGLVADSAIHDFRSYNSYEKTLEWLKVHEPQLWKLCSENTDKLQDFRSMRNYSYGASRVISRDRWALVGEAGVFLDPFYSPGNDFISIINTLVADLILRDLKGERVAPRITVYNELFLGIFNSSFETFRGQYEIIGNPRVMPVKVFWDWSYYWNFLGKMFFEDKLTDFDFLRNSRELFERFREINIKMQAFFREESRRNRPVSRKGFFDLAKHKYLYELNASLSNPDLSIDFSQRFEEGLEELERISEEIFSCFGVESQLEVKKVELETEGVFMKYFSELGSMMVEEGR
jgi:flavin-dependent dehydrogenase